MDSSNQKLVADLRDEARIFAMGHVHDLLFQAANSIEQLNAKLKSMENCYSEVKDRVESFNNEVGVKALKERIAQLNGQNELLKKDNEQLKADVSVTKKWHELSCAANEQLRKENEQLNEDGVKALREEVERLKAKQTKLIDEMASHRESISRSHEREQRLRDQRDVVRDMVRLAYKTVKQD